MDEHMAHGLHGMDAENHSLGPVSDESIHLTHLPMVDNNGSDGATGRHSVHGEMVCTFSCTDAFFIQKLTDSCIPFIDENVFPFWVQRSRLIRSVEDQLSEPIDLVIDWNIFDGHHL
jgi:hypothetical protein